MPDFPKRSSVRNDSRCDAERVKADFASAYSGGDTPSPHEKNSRHKKLSWVWVTVLIGHAGVRCGRLQELSGSASRLATLPLGKLGAGDLTARARD